MKARVKATGEIVEVYFYGKEGYDYVCNDKEECYERGELEILDEPDYWTRLEHQAAIAAMQGLVTRGEVLGSSTQAIARDIAEISCEIAYALVEKYKKEE